ncbi:hypothetical protein EDD85DRAFT_956767 [Armillaria nabsnona]|nr:hypothetical protein EDD85DRAFT_956767 [Armillaria nabsnona]
MLTNYQQLHADLNKTLGRIQLANDAPAPIVADIISSKTPPLPKEVAEDLLNENENRLVRVAINASSADPVLATALENALTEALSKVESNARTKLISDIWAIVVDDVTNGQVKGEDVWNVKVVQELVHRLLYVLARDFRGRDSKSPTKAVTLRGLFAGCIYCIAEYTRDDNSDRCGMALLTKGSLFEMLDNECSAWVDKFELERSRGDNLIGRDLAIQNCLFMVLSAITGLQPSSFAPSDKKLKEKKKSVDDVEKHTDFTFGYTTPGEKQPLCLKGAQGHFPEEVEVITSKQLSQAVSKTAQNRGLAWTGSYAFRRAIATLLSDLSWAKVLNSEHADRLFAHGLDAGSLHNYVDDSSMHDLVAVALLERALTDEANQIGWTSV